MTKTNAQRQAEYRERCKTRSEGYSATLHTQLAYGEKKSLEALASYNGVTQRELLERLIRECYEVTTQGMSEAEVVLFDSKNLRKKP